MKGFKESLKILLPYWLVFTAILLSIEYLRADNEINITQSGDGIELYIEQEGKDNLVDFSMQHWGNKVKIIQHGHKNHVTYGHWGSLSSGDIDLSLIHI